MKKNYFSLPARTVPRCEDGRRPVASASSMPRLFNFHLLCSGMVLLLLKFKTTLLWRKGRYFATFRCALEIYKCILKVFFLIQNTLDYMKLWHRKTSFRQTFVYFMLFHVHWTIQNHVFCPTVVFLLHSFMSLTECRRQMKI